MDLKLNEIVNLEKPLLLEAIDKVLNEDGVIKYTGLYSVQDQERVFKMINESMQQSDDVGIILFYDK
jgi:hypothetical protein